MTWPLFWVVYTPRLEAFSIFSSCAEIQIDGICLDSPFNRFKVDENWRFQQALKNPFKKPSAKKVKEIYESLEFWNNLPAPVDKPIGQYSAVETFAQSPLSQKPIRYLHGKKDRTTSITHQSEAKERFKDHPNIKFKTFPNEEHCGTFKYKGKEYRVAFRDPVSYLAEAVSLAKEVLQNLNLSNFLV